MYSLDELFNRKVLALFFDWIFFSEKVHEKCIPSKKGLIFDNLCNKWKLAVRQSAKYLQFIFKALRLWIYFKKPPEGRNSIHQRNSESNSIKGNPMTLQGFKMFPQSGVLTFGLLKKALTLLYFTEIFSRVGYGQHNSSP